MLIVLSGLPGVGKTGIARELARLLRGVHIRVDSIEQAIRESGVAVGSIDDSGYRVGYAVAEDNLRLGHVVVADSVNPWPVTRDSWVRVANRSQAAVVEIEVVCSDEREHRRRVEQRFAETGASGAPTWEEVVSRDYRGWERQHVVIDTANRTVEQCATILRAVLPTR
jgi:predicted kinase